MWFARVGSLLPELEWNDALGCCWSSEGGISHNKPIEIDQVVCYPWDNGLLQDTVFLQTSEIISITALFGGELIANCSNRNDCFSISRIGCPWRVMFVSLAILNPGLSSAPPKKNSKSYQDPNCILTFIVWIAKGHWVCIVQKQDGNNVPTIGAPMTSLLLIYRCGEICAVAALGLIIAALIFHLLGGRSSRIAQQTNAKRPEQRCCAQP